MSGLRLEVSPECWELEFSKQPSTLVNSGADDRVVIPVSGVSGEFEVRCLRFFLRNTRFFNKH